MTCCRQALRFFRLVATQLLSESGGGVLFFIFYFLVLPETALLRCSLKIGA